MTAPQPGPGAFPALNEVMPYRGRCEMGCGWPDARHRVCDAMAERLVAGDDPRDVAEDYFDNDGRYSRVNKLAIAVAHVEPLRRQAERERRRARKAAS